MPVIAETLHFTIQSKVTFSGLSYLSGDKEHTVRATFHGNWKIRARIPKAPLADEMTGLALSIFPPEQWIIKGGALETTLSIESMKGEKQASITFVWDVKNGRTCPNFMDWNEFWHKNAEHRRDDGFCVIIDLVSQPPVVHKPNVLLTVSELTKGNNIFDTQFFLFSKPRRYNGVHGAKNPLPVYANSAFLRSQCEYFDTSMFYLP
jgi:hypothetical protein